MDVGLVLMLVGLVVIISGCLLFRHPGVPFMFHGPVWRANKYLKPPGVALWIGGQVISAVGAALWVWSRLT